MDPLSQKDYEEDVRELRFRLGGAGAFLIFVTAIGVMGYRLIDPDAGWVNAFYMTAITLTTVGFGEVIDLSNNPGGRVFTAVLILVGMGGVLYFVSTATAFVLEGQLGHVFWRRRMEKKAAKLDGHVIVCGSGSTALYTANELIAVRRQVLVVAEDAEGYTFITRELSGTPVLLGDPTEDEVLRSAGIERAAGLVACTDSDRENLIITVTARQLNAGIRIVARVTDIDHQQKVRRVGADAVVSPNYIGGLRLASELIRPTVVSFLDEMLRDKTENRRIDEIQLPEGSPSVGKTVAELGIEENSGGLLLAIRTADGQWVYNPHLSRTVGPDEVLILLGSPQDLGDLCENLDGVMVSRPMRQEA